MLTGVESVAEVVGVLVVGGIVIGVATAADDDGVGAAGAPSVLDKPQPAVTTASTSPALTAATDRILRMITPRGIHALTEEKVATA